MDGILLHRRAYWSTVRQAASQGHIVPAHDVKRKPLCEGTGPLRHHVRCLAIEEGHDLVRERLCVAGWDHPPRIAHCLGQAAHGTDDNRKTAGEPLECDPTEALLGAVNSANGRDKQKVATRHLRRNLLLGPWAEPANVVVQTKGIRQRGQPLALNPTADDAQVHGVRHLRVGQMLQGSQRDIVALLWNEASDHQCADLPWPRTSSLDRTEQPSVHAHAYAVNLQKGVVH